MPKITVKLHEKTQIFYTENAVLLAEVLLKHNSAPHMFCGGNGTCGKCKVFVHGHLSPISVQERTLLKPAEIENGVRLSCLTKVIGDCEISLDSTVEIENIKEDGSMPKFTTNPLFENFGAAIDIGTTTLVAKLYNKHGVLAAVSTANPQSKFGADVITRIGKALDGFSCELAKLLQDSISSMIIKLETAAKISSKSIDALVITGNTAMLYLFTKRNPDALSHAPFEADEHFGKFISASDLNLPCKDGAMVYLPECMSAFVGADITTAILASEMCLSNSPNLLVDIGTNGEMALWSNSHLYCCSTAAGPTFEGAGISYGMQGIDGAIDHVDIIDGKINIHVIGSSVPIGICGSGIIDAVSSMLQLEIIDNSGFLEDEEYLLIEKVKINQKDIRMVQLAKSAICAGIRTLLKVSGLSMAELSRLYIAGGFGSFLNIFSASHIGLIPHELEAKSTILGNAALSGAAMLLLNRDFIELSRSITKNASTIELTTSTVFMDYYVDGMIFAE